MDFTLFDSKHYGLDFSSFHTPAELSAPSIDCFEQDLDQLGDLFELQVTQVNNPFEQIQQSIGPPSSITSFSEDTLSFYSEPFNHSPQSSYSFDMDFNRISVQDYSTSFSDYAPPNSYTHFTPPTIAPAHISTTTTTTTTTSVPSQQDKSSDPRKKYKCPNCPRAFARAYNLKTHMATHDPNRLKPHVCPHPSCGRSFSRKHDLGRHLVSIHRGDEDALSHHSASTKVSIGVDKGPRGWCDSCGKGYVGKASACHCRDVS